MKTPVLLLAGVAALSASLVTATPIRQTLDIVATVPADTFYVKPQLGWPQTPVQIAYDPVNKGFDTYRLALQVKNTFSNVSAALAYEAVLTEDNLAATLPLQIAIDGKTLGVTPIDIHSQSPNEAVRPLTITSIERNPTIGNYSGTVSLVFDAIAATP